MIRHPRGEEETEVPIAHLPDAAAMADHYVRLAGKTWITDDAIEELAQIAAGART